MSILVSLNQVAAKKGIGGILVIISGENGMEWWQILLLVLSILISLCCICSCICIRDNEDEIGEMQEVAVVRSSYIPRNLDTSHQYPYPTVSQLEAMIRNEK